MCLNPLVGGGDELVGHLLAAIEDLIHGVDLDEVGGDLLTCAVEDIAGHYGVFERINALRLPMLDMPPSPRDKPP